jgi:hypothetical protein
MTAIVTEWLLRPETLAWTSVALLFVWVLRPLAEYLDRDDSLKP